VYTRGVVRTTCCLGAPGAPKVTGRFHIHTLNEKF
jgi:hypothetical protein